MVRGDRSARNVFKEIDLIPNQRYARPRQRSGNGMRLMPSGQVRCINASTSVVCSELMLHKDGWMVRKSIKVRLVACDHHQRPLKPARHKPLTPNSIKARCFEPCLNQMHLLIGLTIALLPAYLYDGQPLVCASTYFCFQLRYVLTFCRNRNNHSDSLIDPFLPSNSNIV